MMPSILSRMIPGLLAAVMVFADTVTFIDTGKPASTRSLNGSAAMSNGTVALDAQFASGQVTYKIPISRVLSIEFNLVGFNPGAPPQASALGEGPKAPPRSEQPLVANAVELRGSGGHLEPCKVVNIDEKMVRCEAAGGAKPREYQRILVLRLVVRGDQ